MKNTHDKVNALENARIPALMWKYFLPAFAGVIINSLYNIVDRIFIGQGVGALALSGLSAVFPIMLIMMAFGMLIGMGAGVRISINLGKKDFNRAEKVLGNAFTLIIIMAVLLTVLGFLIKSPMLRMFGAGPETVDYANDYLNIILFGSLFNMMGFSLNNLIRSEGNANIAMYSMLISAGLNLVLDPIFIFVLDMGVKGAAWATIISQFVLMIWVIRHFLSKRSVIKLKPSNFKPEKEIILYIITIGFAPFSMQMAASLVQVTFNMQLVKFGGDLAVGAMGIIISVTMLIIMSIIAINMAIQPIIGFNYGAGNFKRVKETLMLAMKYATFVSIGGFLLVELFPHSIIRLFNSQSEELLNIGVKGLRIFLAALPIIGFQIIVSNYFQSIGKAGIAAFLSMLRQVIVLIPVLLILPGYLGLTGVWLASPVSDIVSGIVISFYLVREIKHLNAAILLEK
jgi:putative MATE family efflux protein